MRLLFEAALKHLQLNAFVWLSMCSVFGQTFISFIVRNTYRRHYSTLQIKWRGKIRHFFYSCSSAYRYCAIVHPLHFTGIASLIWFFCSSSFSAVFISFCCSLAASQRVKLFFIRFSSHREAYPSLFYSRCALSSNELKFCFNTEPT